MPPPAWPQPKRMPRAPSAPIHAPAPAPPPHAHGQRRARWKSTPAWHATAPSLRRAAGPSARVPHSLGPTPQSARKPPPRRATSAPRPSEPHAQPPPQPCAPPRPAWPDLSAAARPLADASARCGIRPQPAGRGPCAPLLWLLLQWSPPAPPRRRVVPPRAAQPQAAWWPWTTPGARWSARRAGLWRMQSATQPLAAASLACAHAPRWPPRRSPAVSPSQSPVRLQPCPPRAPAARRAARGTPRR
mmetsp:Transcript_19209/g.54615  ORF Transcript_19209/g.54615 Transcript_19209/m.54615 type:complete len:245 (+) Transcript_19209:680-1414(+)